MAVAAGPTVMNAIGSRSPGLGSAATRFSSRRRTTRSTSSPSGARAPRRARRSAATCSTRSVTRLARRRGESTERSTAECATIAAMRGPAFASRNACSMPSRRLSMPSGATTGMPMERAACHGDARRTRYGLSSRRSTTPPSAERGASSARRAALIAIESCSLGIMARTRLPSLAARTARLTARAPSTESVIVRWCASSVRATFGSASSPNTGSNGTCRGPTMASTSSSLSSAPFRIAWCAERSAVPSARRSGLLQSAAVSPLAGLTRASPRQRPHASRRAVPRQGAPPPQPPRRPRDAPRCAHAPAQ